MGKELPVPRASVISRLQKIEGQLRGLQKMVADERLCPEVLVQLAAVRSGVESVAVLVLRNYAHICAGKKGTEPGAELADAVAMWVGGKPRARP